MAALHKEFMPLSKSITADPEVKSWTELPSLDAEHAGKCISKGAFAPFTNEAMAERLDDKMQDAARGFAFNIAWLDLKTEGMKDQFPDWVECVDEGKRNLVYSTYV